MTCPVGLIRRVKRRIRRSWRHQYILNMYDRRLFRSLDVPRYYGTLKPVNVPVWVNRDDPGNPGSTR